MLKTKLVLEIILRIVFAGTPQFAVPCLEALIASSHDVIAVYSQPDRPSGRGQMLQPSAVKKIALQHYIPVHQPVNFKELGARETLKNLGADVMVVIAYGLILPSAVLTIPTLGCINVHASLLPRWRGAAPIQHALLHGDTETGITIMQMDAGMDTGHMLQKTSIIIHNHDTLGGLHDRLSQLAISPLLETLTLLEKHEAIAVPQATEGVTYASKINKADVIINWSLPAQNIACHIRAFHPAALTFAENIPVRIHHAQITRNLSKMPPGTILSIDKQGIEVATLDNTMLIEKLQFPNKKPIAVHDWINGNRAPLSIGLILQ